MLPYGYELNEKIKLHDKIALFDHWFVLIQILNETWRQSSIYCDFIKIYLLDRDFVVMASTGSKSPNSVQHKP